MHYDQDFQRHERIYSFRMLKDFIIGLRFSSIMSVLRSNAIVLAYVNSAARYLATFQGKAQPLGLIRNHESKAV